MSFVPARDSTLNPVIRVEPAVTPVGEVESHLDELRRQAGAARDVLVEPARAQKSRFQAR